VSNAGGLGSLAVGASNVTTARTSILDLKARTSKPYNINVFAHKVATKDAQREAKYLDTLKPFFQSFDANAPTSLHEIYQSFIVDENMLNLFTELKPPVVSFHFGLPPPKVIQTLRSTGAFLMATATNLAEARLIQEAGIDAVVAQGFEAGGHRGIFDPAAPDDKLSTATLTRLLVKNIRIPIVAAGGIMDGDCIGAMMRLGATAVQLGTAFIACSESAADQAYRRSLSSSAAYHTCMTPVISGRPARALPNKFTALSTNHALLDNLPSYPIAYDAGKALHAAAKARGDFGFGAYWAGQGAPLSRSMPAGELMSILAYELNGRDAH
jgi:nitronate monooxygenase